MWNIIFEVLAFFFCTVCFYRIAKCYGDKFKSALANMKRTEKREHRYNFADYLEFRQYRLAAILFKVATYVCLYFALLNLSALLN
ncbi:hypothetical protein ECBP5_0023 [Escherichia phage ECBP5]|uniref:Uncharacterized protein n=1 Tax=Escherichia phage ECBP5 TaxID=1498172 RepID=A0A0F6N5S6_9CAUD|nr:hypothetical protein ECBP5_0023 [Escherichia phage ECBP5]AID17677.1 hypothetical protein ECBP5_0023 [Escherichia phage ECBP5]